jgi:hypothetical protein
VNWGGSALWGVAVVFAVVVASFGRAAAAPADVAVVPVTIEACNGGSDEERVMGVNKREEFKLVADVTAKSLLLLLLPPWSVQPCCCSLSDGIRNRRGEGVPGALVLCCCIGCCCCCWCPEPATCRCDTTR